MNHARESLIRKVTPRVLAEILAKNRYRRLQLLSRQELFRLLEKSVFGFRGAAPGTGRLRVVLGVHLLLGRPGPMLPLTLTKPRSAKYKVSVESTTRPKGVPVEYGVALNISPCGGDRIRRMKVPLLSYSAMVPLKMLET